MTSLFTLIFLPCAFALALGMAVLPVHPARGILLIAPILIWCFALWRFVTPYAKALEVMSKDTDRKRAAQIIERLELVGERMALRGWVPVIPGLLLTPVAGFIVAFGLLDSKWPAVVVASVLLIYGLALLMRGLPCVGKPMLACARDGIETAGYGPVPWQDIEGIALTRVSARGRDFYTLELLVPKLPQLTAQMHPCARLGYALRWGDRRQRLRFPLAFAGERPDVIELTIRTMWERVTARRNRWFPQNPKLGRELQKIEDDYARAVADAERELKAMHPEAARMLEQVKQAGPRSGSTRPDPAIDSLQRAFAARAEPLQRLVAARPVYRKGAIVSLVLIAVMLAAAFLAAFA